MRSTPTLGITYYAVPGRKVGLIHLIPESQWGYPSRPRLVHRKSGKLDLIRHYYLLISEHQRFTSPAYKRLTYKDLYREESGRPYFVLATITILHGNPLVRQKLSWRIL
jgi:hypothetical protein